MPRKIVYVTETFPFPTGGPRVAYRHVEMLRRNGFDAVVFEKGNQKPFFEFDPTTVTKTVQLSRSDILVYPEPWAKDLAAVKALPNRKVVFCQNHFYVSHGLNGASDYKSAHGVSTVFCCGDIIARYLRDVIKMDRVPIVHNGIDRALFCAREKELQIAYMPRKMVRPAEFIRDTFNRMHPQFAHVPWVKIDNISEAEAARILGESAIFLSLAFMEGVGLPPLEAMSAGALVVGFDGDGGKEYATKENGRWYAEGDLSGCIEALRSLAEDLTGNGSSSQKQITAGNATAERYSLERMESELVAFWREELDQ